MSSIPIPNQYGRTLLTSTGRPVRVSFDAAPIWAPIGKTIDFNTIAPVGVDTTLPDLTLVKNGQRYMRFGQVLTKITLQPAQTITVTGSPTGGSFTITGTNPNTNVQTTQTVLWNSTVAQTQANMDAIFGAGNTVVSGAGALPANVQTVTFQGNLIATTPGLMTTNSAGLTGGAGPAATAAVVTAGGNYGRFGPYDPAAVDGRANLNRGECYILDETWVENPAGASFANLGTPYPALIEGGRVWWDRLLQSGAGAASLAAGPTQVNLLAAFPLLVPVKQ